MRVKEEAVKSALYGALSRRYSAEPLSENDALEYWLLCEGMRQMGFGDVVEKFKEARADEESDERTRQAHDAYHGW